MARPVHTICAIALLVLAAACFERGGDHRAGAEAQVTAQIDAAARSPIRPRTDVLPRHADPDATISIALEAEPAHLNPLLGGDAITNRVALGDIYEGLLCGLGITEAPTPCLAERVSVNDAGTVWRFELRDGVRWHDGVAVTRADVEFTLGLLRGPNRAPSYLASELDDVVSVEPAGERGLVVTFSGFRMGRSGLFARMPILPAHVFADVPASSLATSAHNHEPIGTGPMRLVSWKRGESIELERNDDYWGQPSHARRVVYRVLPDRQQALRALGAGLVDVVVQLPVDEAIAAAAADDIDVFAYETSAYLAAVYNLRNPDLAHVEVRRALTRLMDTEGMAKELFLGNASPITGPYLAGDDSFDPEVTRLAFDPAPASGSTRRPTLTVLVPAGSRTMGRIADIWASDARPFATLNIAEVPYADMLGRLREGDFEVAMMAFTTSRDLDLYTRFHSSQVGGENYGALVDPALDGQLEAARAEPRADERARIQRRIHRLVYELQPYTFIVSDTRVGLVRRGVGGTAAGGGVPAARSLWRERS